MNRLFYSIFLTLFFCTSQTGNANQASISPKNSIFRQMAVSTFQALRYEIIQGVLSGLLIHATSSTKIGPAIKIFDRIYGYGPSGFLSILNGLAYITFTKNSSPYDNLPLAPESIQTLVKEISSCMRISFPVSAYINTTYDARADVYNRILINDKFLSDPVSIQKSIIAHELAHIIYSDPRTTGLFKTFALPLAAAICFVGVHAVNKFENWANQQLNGNDSQHPAAKYISAILSSAIFQTGVSTLLEPLYNRWQEKRADLTAARLVKGAAEGLIVDFSRHINDKSSLFSTHPHPADRIAYLQPYVQGQCGLKQQ